MLPFFQYFWLHSPFCLKVSYSIIPPPSILTHVILSYINIYLLFKSKALYYRSLIKFYLWMFTMWFYVSFVRYFKSVTGKGFYISEKYLLLPYPQNPHWMLFSKKRNKSEKKNHMKVVLIRFFFFFKCSNSDNLKVIWKSSLLILNAFILSKMSYATHLVIPSPPSCHRLSQFHKSPLLSKYFIICVQSALKEIWN